MARLWQQAEGARAGRLCLARGNPQPPGTVRLHPGRDTWIRRAGQSWSEPDGRSRTGMPEGSTAFARQTSGVSSKKVLPLIDGRRPAARASGPRTDAVSCRPGIAPRSVRAAARSGPAQRAGRSRGCAACRAGYPRSPCPDSRAKHPCFALRDPRPPGHGHCPFVMMLRRGSHGRHPLSTDPGNAFATDGQSSRLPAAVTRAGRAQAAQGRAAAASADMDVCPSGAPSLPGALRPHRSSRPPINRTQCKLPDRGAAKHSSHSWGEEQKKARLQLPASGLCSLPHVGCGAIVNDS